MYISLKMRIHSVYMSRRKVEGCKSIGMDHLSQKGITYPQKHQNKKKILKEISKILPQTSSNSHHQPKICLRCSIRSCKTGVIASGNFLLALDYAFILRKAW